MYLKNLVADLVVALTCWAILCRLWSERIGEGVIVASSFLFLLLLGNLVAYRSYGWRSPYFGLLQPLALQSRLYS